MTGFFVLSGYFLEKEFEQSNELNLHIFYRKKAINLLPEYLFVSIPALFITGLFPQIYPVDLSQAEGSSFTLISLMEIANNPSWFMTCLFCFIALAPILFCIHCLKWGILLAFCIAAAYHIILFEAYGGSDWLNKAAQINFVFFVGGMLARQLSAKVKVNRIARLIIIAISLAGLLLPRTLHCGWGTAWGNGLFCGVCFMLLVPMLHTAHSRRCQAIAWFASLTYAMYLFHSPVKRTGICLLTRMTSFTEEEILTPWAYLSFLLLTILFAALFHYFKLRYIIKANRL